MKAHPHPPEAVYDRIRNKIPGENNKEVFSLSRVGEVVEMRPEECYFTVRHKLFFE